MKTKLLALSTLLILPLFFVGCEDPEVKFIKNIDLPGGPGVQLYKYGQHSIYVSGGKYVISDNIKEGKSEYKTDVSILGTELNKK